MNSNDRKKIAVITKYIIEAFSDGDWLNLGQITGKLKVITDHSRLFRSLSYGDDDYGFCATEVIDEIFKDNINSIDDVIDHFDIDLWYFNKDPEKYKRIFSSNVSRKADFWKESFFRVFISHLSSNRIRMSAIKSGLDSWGISAFVAHEDIEATREWREEVEAGLETMEMLIAVVEPGFKESDWCAQEVGYALGRKIDILPLRAGLDPFGFFGKYQGIQIKGKQPKNVVLEIVQTLLKKPQHREKILNGIAKSFSQLNSNFKIEHIRQLDSWSIVTNLQMKAIIEQISLNQFDQLLLAEIIEKVGAFEQKIQNNEINDLDENIPF